jgi:glucan biosynthesis protein C
MDALRAGAALAVVATHAAVAYMDVPMPGLVWAIRDRSSSPWVDWIFWWCNGVSMPLFFLLAGFFAAPVCDERGPGGFLRQRTRRLLLPFIAGCILILPVTFYIWAGGWLLTGQCTANEIRRVHFASTIQQSLYGPAHLWFLEYLFLLCLLFAGFASVRSYRAEKWRLQRQLPAPAPLLFAGATALILWVNPAAPLQFHNSFVPAAARLLYYSVFFVAGVWLFRRGRCLPGRLWSAALCVVLSFVAFCGVAWLLPRHLGAQLGGGLQLLLVGTMVVFVWCSVFGFHGLAHHLFDRESVSVAYMAAASYWVYLVHFPIVGAAHIGLSRLPGPALVKYVVVVVVTLLVSLVSYEHVVRRTFVGSWLNGARRVVPSADGPRRASARAVAQAR